MNCRRTSKHGPALFAKLHCFLCPIKTESVRSRNTAKTVILITVFSTLQIWRRKPERTPKMPENNAKSESNIASKSLGPMSQSTLRFLSGSRGNEVPRWTSISHHVYCRKRKCLTWLNSKSGISPLITCAKRQKLFHEKSSQLQRRNWWIRIKKDEPQHAKNYADAMGKSFEALDAYYQVTTWHTNWSASFNVGPARTGLPITCPCGQISTMEHEIRRLYA